MQGESVFVTVSFAPIEHMRYSAILPVFLDGNFAKVMTDTCQLAIQGIMSVCTCLPPLKGTKLAVPAFLFVFMSVLLDMLVTLRSSCMLMQSYLDIRVDGEGQDPSLRFGVRECILPTVRG